ncbi:hypothetical protein G9A89_002662 [Geosiphon pyriformis]|nr:hypothetical protein G9A89_002662 [Geosiphon pyriformis]
MMEIRSVLASDTRLASTLISCLSRYERGVLDREKIRTYEKKPIRPIFDYPAFITELDYRKLDLAIRGWYSSTLKETPKIIRLGKGSIVFIQVLKMILSRSKRLLSLEFEKTRETINIPEITGFTGALISLSHLERFTICQYSAEYKESEKGNIARTFASMAHVCQSINYLYIKIDGFSQEMEKSLIRLIRVQNEIRRVIIEAWSVDPRSFIFAMQCQAHSLTRLEFKWSYLSQASLEALVICSKLDTLVFIECKMKSEIWTPLLSASFKLKKLYFLNKENTDAISSSDCSPLIRLAGENLTDLVVMIQNCSASLFETIADHCPNLVRFGILVDKSTARSLQKIFNNCGSLRQFSLRYDGQYIIDTDPFLFQLAWLLPVNITHLNIHFSMSIEALGVFLAFCRAPLQQLGIAEEVGLSNEHLRMIVKFAKEKGNLRRVGFGAFEFDCSIFDTELLDEAKKILEFVENLWFDMYGDYAIAEF